MKKFGFLLGVFASVISPVYGMYESSCCGGCDDYCFELEVAALYWRTCSENRVYGFTEDVFDGGVIDNNFDAVESENDWGVKARGAYFFNRCGFGALEYTYFDSDTDDHTDNLFTSYFFSEVSTPASVDAEVDTCYQRLRGLVGVYFFKTGCADLYGFGGVSWIYVKEHDTLVATPDSTISGPQSLRQRMKFNGAGFELGFGWNYNIWCGLGIGGEFNGVAAIGHRTGKAVITSDVETALLNTNRTPSTTICLPGYDVLIELYYEWDLCCYPVRFAIGYEHHQFFNILYGNPLFVTDVFASNNSQVKSHFDMGFGGLTLSAGVKF